MPQPIASPKSDVIQNLTGDDVIRQLPASLGTFLARIQFDNGSMSPLLRGFCDTGAQVNLITESCVQTMQLRREKIRIPIEGVGSSITSRGVVKLILTHRNDYSAQVPLTALIVSQIASRLPDEEIESPFDGQIPIDKLADPAYQVPANVDMLLGAGAWAAIITDKMQRVSFNGRHAIAQMTSLGWVVYGHMFSTTSARLRGCHASVDIEDARIDQMLIKYWNADAIPKTRLWTADEQRAEDIFVATHRRETNGRYTVNIPFACNKKPLGDSARTAKACFFGVERRLHREPSLFIEYKAVFDNYRALHHMVLAPARPIDPALTYYIPHHAINVAGGKGKFRVVFNASAPSSTGISLNDQQLVGPRLQDDLVSIFLRFRANRYGMTADIKQMFRQVNIASEHWNFQRVFWRDSPNDELKEYVTTVICWGQTSAGFNAVRAVRQCAIDEQQRFPIGSLMASNDLYFDDMLSGTHSETDLLTAYQQISQLLGAGGFELSKWATNNQALAMHIQSELNAEADIPMDAGVLGMRWHPSTDMLRIKLNNEFNITDHQLTKRKAISATAQIFDPTGLVLPVIVIGKILQQDIWRSGIGWDEPLPIQLIEKWHHYQLAIAQLHQIAIPRWLRIGPVDQVELHVFTDASEQAMGAVAYFRVQSIDGTTTTNLITARSKIAPVKRVTIPRLELMAALIGAELAQFVRTTFHMPNVEATFWTDSTIVIHWLRRDPNVCKPFIANRIVAIRDASENGIWRHVQGTDNPADLLTRGIGAEQLANASLWWLGPSWLADSISAWPISCVTTLTPEQQALLSSEDKIVASAMPTEMHRSKSGQLVGVVVKGAVAPFSIRDTDGNQTPITVRRSELSSLLRVTAYAFRFAYNTLERARSRRMSNERRFAPHAVEICDRSSIPAITNVERQKALRHWIADAQSTYFSAEIKAIREEKLLPRSSSIVKLRPIIDQNGFLRVGGRLANADIPEETKHQFILPPQARISQLIIRDAHFATIHGGPQLMMAHLRRSYWITRARQIVKSVVHHCPICVRYDQAQNVQLI